jgi:hypothetical protein
MKKFKTFEPYILLVIAPPLAAVIGGLITLWIASKHPDGMVVDDYYRYGLTINNRIVEDEQANHLNLKATLRMTPASCGATATPCLKIKLDGNLAPLPNELTITFWHATQSGIDQTLLLIHTMDQFYQAPLMQTLALGKWHVVLQGKDWRLTGFFWVKENEPLPSLVLTPKAL